MREALKAAIHRCGALSAYHRIRNRHRLTVVGFHRVLAEDDPRWATAMPTWTVSEGLFAHCLSFFARHYNVVSLGDLVDRAGQAKPLPERPLLITFDDGWADNAEYALPLLRQHGLPAVLFCATAAIGQADGFWQEETFAALRRQQVANPDLEAFWQALFGSTPMPEPPVEDEAIDRAINELARLDASQRAAVLVRLPKAPPTTKPAMLGQQQLRELQAAGFAIGSHGETHEPLPQTPDQEREMTNAWCALQDWLPDIDQTAMTIAFPHGRYSPESLNIARRLGHRLIFTTERGLAPLEGRRLCSDLLPRVDITPNHLNGPDGRFAPYRLAMWLFGQPAHQPGPSDGHAS